MLELTFIGARVDTHFSWRKKIIITIHCSTSLAKIARVLWELHRYQTLHPQKTTTHTKNFENKNLLRSIFFFFLHIQNNNGGGSTVVEVVINSSEAFFLIKKIPSLPRIIWAVCRDGSKVLKLELEWGFSHPSQPSSPNHIADIDTTQPSPTKSQQTNQAHQKKEKRNGKKLKNEN